MQIIDSVRRVTAFVAVSLLLSTASRAATITVARDGNLHQAITNAQPGDTIVLEPGATYVGNFTLPNKGPSDAVITIRTADDPALPGEGGRIDPRHAPLLAKIRSGNALAAIQTAPFAHHWRLTLLEFEANANGAGDIITLGDGSGAQSSLASVPHDLTLDRLYIHGDEKSGQKRAISLNSASTTITGCYIAEIKALGQDSQGIAGWNGPGPFVIVNNYVEAAAENLLFGGADPSIPDLVPSDITVASNQFTKPVEWRTQKWVVKNLFELKNARRVTVTDNTFEHNWPSGQSGYAILFTVRNQDGRCGWCQVEQVTFERNIVQHTAAGIQILGFDNNHPSRQTQNIFVRDNLFADIDRERWGGNGIFVTISGGPRDITIDHNTIVQDRAAALVQADGPPILGFVFTNNLAKHNDYGIIGTDRGVGNDSISAFFPGSEITRNVIAGGAASRYPGGNTFPSVAQFEAQFVSYAGGDFRLALTSVWRGAGLDGLDLGAVFGPRKAERPDKPGRDRGATKVHVSKKVP